MRIIGGKYRSLALASFKGEDIRPTADRVKESLFNILYTSVAGSRALDLFCGSGGLGLECISRGAEEVVFNDISADSVALLKKNLAKLRGASGYKIYNLPYAECLARLTGQFGLIFLDPPYRTEAGLEALGIISFRNLLKEGGTAVLEWDRPAGGVAGLELYDTRKYGKTYLSFYKVSK